MSDAEVINPQEFRELREDVATLRKEVHELNLAVRDGFKDKETLSKELTDRKQDNLVLWEHVNANTKSCDTAHGKLRTAKTAVLVGWSITVFFASLIQILVMWYLTSFVSRADTDHDLLVRSLTNQEYILRWIQQHEKRDSSSVDDLQPRNKWQTVPPIEGADPTNALFLQPGTSLEKQPKEYQLHSSWVLYLQVYPLPTIRETFISGGQSSEPERHQNAPSELRGGLHSGLQARLAWLHSARF